MFNIFKNNNADKQIIYMTPIVPGQEDYHGNIIEAEDVEEAAHSFMKAGGFFNIEHIDGTKINATVLESSVLRADAKIEGQDLIAGTWLLVIKIEDASEWQKVKDGVYKGCSIEGTSSLIVPVPREIYKRIEDVPSNIKRYKGATLSVEQANLWEAIYAEVSGDDAERERKAWTQFELLHYIGNNEWKPKQGEILKSQVMPISVEMIERFFQAVKDAVAKLNEKYTLKIDDEFKLDDYWRIEEHVLTKGKLWQIYAKGCEWFFRETDGQLEYIGALFNGGVYDMTFSVDDETAKRFGEQENAWREYIIAKLNKYIIANSNFEGLTLII